MEQDVCVVDTTYHKVMKELAQAHLDGMLLTDPANIGFVSGFLTEDAYIIISSMGKVLITDSRYYEVAERKCPGWDVICITRENPLEQVLADICEKWQIATLGFEEDKITQGFFAQLQQQLPSVSLAQAGHILKKVRMVKRGYELDCIRKAARAADDAFLFVLKQMKPGVRTVFTVRLKRKENG